MNDVKTLVQHLWDTQDEITDLITITFYTREDGTQGAKIGCTAMPVERFCYACMALQSATEQHL